MTKEEMIAFIKENLTLNYSTAREYTGGFSGDSLYEEYTKIELVFCGEVIGRCCA